MPIDAEVRASRTIRDCLGSRSALAAVAALVLASSTVAAGSIGSGKADLSITAFGAYSKPLISKNSLGKKMASIKVGTPVWVSCLWEAKPSTGSKFIVAGELVFNGSIAVNGKPLHFANDTIHSLPDWQKSRENGSIGPVQWLPPAAGKYSLGCTLDQNNVLAEAPNKRANNKRIESVTVWRGLRLTDNLNVAFGSPQQGQHFAYDADLQVPLQVSISAPLYALVNQRIVKRPEISFEIEHLGRDGESEPVFSKSIQVKTNPTELTLDLGWFTYRDLAAGRYDVTVRLVGGVLPDIISGPAMTTRFYVDPLDMSTRRGLGSADPAEPGVLQPANVASSTPVLTPPPPAVPVAAAAPPNPCGIDVTYYVPQPPVIRSSATAVRATDRVTIRCDYKAVTAHIEWPACDTEAQSTMRYLQFAKESGSRYSGMLRIDGQNVGVTTSPQDGGDFSSEQVWSYGDAGSHEVNCQIDNGLKYAAKEGVTYLAQAVSHKVGIAGDIRNVLPLDTSALKVVAMDKLRAQIAPLPDGAAALLRISGAPNFDPADEFIGVAADGGTVAMSNDWNDSGAPEAKQPPKSAPAAAQVAVGVTAALPDLVVLSAYAQLRCRNGAPALVAMGTLKNISTVTFTPPTKNTLVAASVYVGDEILYGRTTLPAMQPDEQRQIDVLMNEGEALPAGIVAGAQYAGEFEANRMHTVNERQTLWNNSTVLGGTLTAVSCRSGR